MTFETSLLIATALETISSMLMCETITQTNLDQDKSLSYSDKITTKSSQLEALIRQEKFPQMDKLNQLRLQIAVRQYLNINL